MTAYKTVIEIQKKELNEIEKQITEMKVAGIALDDPLLLRKLDNQEEIKAFIVDLYFAYSKARTCSNDKRGYPSAGYRQFK